jgi:hypothetical protein
MQQQALQALHRFEMVQAKDEHLPQVLKLVAYLQCVVVVLQ